VTRLTKPVVTDAVESLEEIALRCGAPLPPPGFDPPADDDPELAAPTPSDEQARENDLALATQFSSEVVAVAAEAAERDGDGDVAVRLRAIEPATHARSYQLSRWSKSRRWAQYAKSQLRTPHARRGSSRGRRPQRRVTRQRARAPSSSDPDEPDDLSAEPGEAGRLGVEAAA